MKCNALRHVIFIYFFYNRFGYFLTRDVWHIYFHHFHLNIAINKYLTIKIHSHIQFLCILFIYIFLKVTKLKIYKILSLKRNTSLIITIIVQDGPKLMNFFKHFMFEKRTKSGTYKFNVFFIVQQHFTH